MQSEVDFKKSMCGFVMLLHISFFKQLVTYIPGFPRNGSNILTDIYIILTRKNIFICHCSSGAYQYYSLDYYYLVRLQDVHFVLFNGINWVKPCSFMYLNLVMYRIYWMYLQHSI